MVEGFSDLEVDTNFQRPSYQQRTALPAQAQQHIHAHSDKTAIENHPPEVDDERFFHKEEYSTPRRRRCGLTTKTFWIVVGIVLVIVVAAAVGGGVGGSLATKHNNSSTDNSTASQSTMSVSIGPVTSPSSLNTTGTPTISISTLTTSSASTTLLVDCPSSDNTVYNPPLTSQLFRKVCSRTYIGIVAINSLNTPTSSLDDCITLCARHNVQQSSQIANGASNICNAVCWRGTIQNDDYPGQCYGFTTTNSSGNFVYKEDSRCNSAALINQAFL